MDDQQSIKCSYCEKTFQTTNGRHKHERNRHSDRAPHFRSKKGCIICGKCNSVTQTISKLCEHLNEAHDFEIKIQHFKFKSRQAFDKWRRDVEKNGSFQFVSYSGAKKLKTCTTQYLQCHRSGCFASEAKGLRTPKGPKSNKLNFHCSAFATVSTYSSNGKVSVDACLDHYGHDDHAARKRIFEEDQAKIVEFLKDGKDFDWILHYFQNGIGVDPRDNVLLERWKLISRKDIRNVQCRFDPNVAQKSSVDFVRVDSWVKEETSKNGQNSALFCYSEHDPATDTFSLGLQTPTQLQALASFGQDVICVNTTHGSNQYGYLLFTILVVDHFGKGLPVAWFITKNEDEVEMKTFFEALRHRVGELRPKVFMSDDLDAYYNAWSQTFGPCRKLLCSWHVAERWGLLVKEKVRLEANRPKVVASLRGLFEEQSEQTFRDCLNSFLFGMDIEEPAFADYFRYAHCRESRIVQWAPWARRLSTIDANLHLERFHRDLKCQYLKRNRNKRLDSLLYTLLAVVRDCFQSETKPSVERHRVDLIEALDGDALRIKKRKPPLVNPLKVAKEIVAQLSRAGPNMHDDISVEILEKLNEVKRLCRSNGQQKSCAITKSKSSVKRVVRNKVAKLALTNNSMHMEHTYT